MVKLTVDNIPVEVQEGTSILNAAKMAGIKIPTLCYLEGISEIGNCRVCVVEVEGSERLVASCNTLAEEGMVVHTNSLRARTARKTNVELLLSQHNTDCTSCVRCGSCLLQEVAQNVGVRPASVSFAKDIPTATWDDSFPLIRDETKCIKCMRCVQICNNIQTEGIWDCDTSGRNSTVSVIGHAKISSTHCAACGQCITHCPVGALRERDDTDKLFDAINDPDKITVVQIAPAVRTAWGEALGLSREEATVEKMVDAFKRMGVDYVFDTVFSADLTIMEEGGEFINMLKAGDESKFPLFTSCCPGWVRFLKGNYPELVSHLSTAKSPQQMFGAVIKTDFAKGINADPSRIFSVSVMPCVAKKAECDLPTMSTVAGLQDVDIVLTTREVDRMISSSNIDPKALTDKAFDTLDGTGAGVIFGATGGVMEAALRSVYFLVTGTLPPVDAFTSVRGRKEWREATFDVAGTPVSVAVTSGLGNARKLMDAIKSGEVKYHFVEVMACPGGCVGGGGQPITPNTELADPRADNIYGLDEHAKLRYSHENPEVQKLYERNDKHFSHCLHTDHFGWDMPKAPDVK